MRIISVEDIKGDEKLAKHIWSDSDIILISEGSIMKKEYIHRLKDLNIEYIYIEDELAKGISCNKQIENQIKEQCQRTVKETLERYSYSSDSELENIRVVAQEIISEILEQSEVLFCISGIREKNEGLYAHSINVCILAILISLKLKLTRKKVNEIAVGSLLHDIGFNYINFDYSQKDYQSYNMEEEIEFKKHVIYGYSAVERETWLSTVAKDIIFSHHESIDGLGYPLRISRDKIKIGSKIVAVCDEFDRLAYGRFTKKLKVHEAIEYIVSQSGIRFDEDIVNIFTESVAVFPNGSMVLTSNGEIAIVLKQNYKFPARPVIRMIYDKMGNKYIDWIEKDLTKVLSLFIKGTL